VSPIDWRELPLVSEDEAEPPTTFGALMRQLRLDSERGDDVEAFDEGLDLAMGLHAGGLDVEALELLEEVLSFIHRDRVPDDRWPWLLNVEGIALAGLRRNREAIGAHQQMRKLAEALPAGRVRDDLVSTALQNLGIVTLEEGRAEEAIELLRESLRMKVALEDYVSAVDVLNSLALAVADTGDIDKAARILADVEDLSRTLREPRRVGAVLGNRASLHLRRGDLSAAEADYRAALRYARQEGRPAP
jgi:tetratricopeptide (TPR) repeat protein